MPLKLFSGFISQKSWGWVKMKSFYYTSHVTLDFIPEIQDNRFLSPKTLIVIFFYLVIFSGMYNNSNVECVLQLYSSD